MKNLAEGAPAQAQKSSRRRAVWKITALAAVAVLTGAVIASSAGAHHGPVGAGCGQVVMGNLTLTHDVGPCVGDGLVVGASNITIDLNGFDIYGTAISDGGAGIRIGTLADETLQTPSSGFNNVTVTDSTYAATVTDDPAPAMPSSEIHNFDAAVAINGGSGNTVQNLWIHDNGDGQSPAAYGDGISITDSTNNLIRNNFVGHNNPMVVVAGAVAGSNGPYSGIGLYETYAKPATAVLPALSRGDTSGNVIRNNVVKNNYRCFTAGQGTCQVDGIRLEPGVSSNTVENNKVIGSALDGIAVFFGDAAMAGNQTNNNVIRNNVVEGNGNHHRTHRKGDGIRIFRSPADFNTVEGNRICGNAASGLRVDSNNNTVTNNRSADGSTDNPINPLVPLAPCGDNHTGPQPSPSLFQNYDLGDSTATVADGLGTMCGTNSWTGNKAPSLAADPNAYNNACTVTP